MILLISCSEGKLVDVTCLYLNFAGKSKIVYFKVTDNNLIGRSTIIILAGAQRRFSAKDLLLFLSIKEKYFFVIFRVVVRGKRLRKFVL